MKSLSIGVLLTLALAIHTALAQSAREPVTVEDGMKIHIVMKESVVEATLENSRARQDFVSLLPLELTLSDYHGTEKIADLPARLSTDGAPEGVTPETGDIAYFAPWGNLAIFYRDFRYSPGLVRLGRIEGNVERFAGDGELKVRIERADAPK